MTTYVRARRPEAPAERKIRFVQSPTIYVDQATMIPDGMHGVSPKKAVPAAVERDLIARGIRPERARILVRRALLKARDRSYGRGRRPMPHPRRNGLGDGEETSALLASVQSRGGDFQRAHATLIAQLGAAFSPEEKLRIQNTIDGLYNDWTAYAVGVKGGAAPYEWNRTDPVDAILIAVRDDLRDTSNLISANKAQQALAKQIAALPTFGMPGKNPLLNIDVPWYVWAAGAATGVAIVTKALKIW